jgi:hypothetical protein
MEFSFSLVSNELRAGEVPGLNLGDLLSRFMSVVFLKSSMRMMKSTLNMGYVLSPSIVSCVSLCLIIPHNFTLYTFITNFLGKQELRRPPCKMDCSSGEPLLGSAS